MSEQPEVNQVPEATILESLRRSGERIAMLKSQIAPLEVQLAHEIDEVAKLHRLYQGSSEPIELLAGSLIESNPQPEKKKDKRSAYNPIKNLNIGVQLSYRYKTAENIPPDKAKKMVYASILRTAIGNGVHAKSCVCEGETQHCPVKGTSEVVYVAVKADLPKKVSAKIEEVHREYVAAYEARQNEVEPEKVMTA